MRGFGVRCDGVLFALIGIVRRPDHLMFFSEYRPQYKPLLRRIATLRAIKAAEKMIEEQLAAGRTVYAVANPDEPDSERILQRLGFEHLCPGPSGEIYACHS